MYKVNHCKKCDMMTQIGIVSAESVVKSKKFKTTIILTITDVSYVPDLRYF